MRTYFVRAQNFVVAAAPAIVSVPFGFFIFFLSLSILIRMLEILLRVFVYTHSNVGNSTVLRWKWQFDLPKCLHSYSMSAKSTKMI